MYILRLDSGEDLIGSVQEYCREKKIKNAWFNAIGSTWDLQLAYYDLDKKTYQIMDFEEFLEIISVTGNISIKDGAIFAHAHGMFGRHDMSTLGGHINRCIISATGEVMLRALGGEIKRGFDEESGLYILG